MRKSQRKAISDARAMAAGTAAVAARAAADERRQVALEAARRELMALRSSKDPAQMQAALRKYSGMGDAIVERRAETVSVEEFVAIARRMGRN